MIIFTFATESMNTMHERLTKQTLGLILNVLSIRICTSLSMKLKR